MRQARGHGGVDGVHLAQLLSKLVSRFPGLGLFESLQPPKAYIHLVLAREGKALRDALLVKPVNG